MLVTIKTNISVWRALIEYFEELSTQALTEFAHKKQFNLVVANGSLERKLKTLDVLDELDSPKP